MKKQGITFLQLVQGYFELIAQAPHWTDEEESELETEFWREVEASGPFNQPDDGQIVVAFRRGTLPQPELTAPCSSPTTIKVAGLVLDGCKTRLDEGEQEALLDAVEACAMLNVPMPDWVRHEYLLRYQLFKRFQARTLGEAFGVTRKKNTNVSAKKKKADLFQRLYMAIQYRREFFGESTGNGKNSLWPKVATHFHISESAANQYYFKEMTNEQIDEFHTYWEQWKADQGLRPRYKSRGKRKPQKTD